MLSVARRAVARALDALARKRGPVTITGSRQQFREHQLQRSRDISDMSDLRGIYIARYGLRVCGLEEFVGPFDMDIAPDGVRAVCVRR
jgi:hypothetical protein